MDSFITIIIVVVCSILILLMVELIIRSRLHREIEQWKQYKQEIKDKPVTDELKRVKDLNMTGQTEKLFEKWRGQWDEVVTSIIPEAEKQLKRAETSTAQFAFRKGKAAMNEAVHMLREADESIENMLSELYELLESYEKSNMKIEQLRQAYRDLKKYVLAHRHTFNLAEEKLEKLLDEALGTFKLFEEATVHGNYLEAKKIAHSLESSISYLQRVVEEVPDLQAECQSALPLQLEELLQGYEDMKQQGYMVDHLELPAEVEFIREELDRCLGYIKALEIAKAKEHMLFLKDRLDSLYDQLENEVTAKHFVETKTALLFDELEELRQNVVRTKEETQFVKQSYQLSDKDVEIQRYIEKQIHILTKRFDVLQLRIAEQDIAFSVIHEEIEDIYEQMQAVKDSHSEYTNMLQALRKEELQARQALKEMRSMMLETRRLLQRSNLPGFPERFVSSLEQAQIAMQQVYEQLEQKPLHMSSVNSKLQEAVDLVDGAYRETKVLIEKANLVERAIQYGNRYRSRSAQAARGLTAAEKLFRQFQYDAALEQAAAVLEEVEPGVMDKIEELVKTE